MRFVVNNQVTIISGDSVTLCVPLTLDGKKFEPKEFYDLFATFKETEATLDSACAFQKMTGAGIINVSDKAFLDIVYLDTQPYKDLMLYGGIVAQHVSTGKRHTVAKFKLYVEYDPQFELDASVPIFTSEPPNTAGRILTAIGDGDKIDIQYLPEQITVNVTTVALTWTAYGLLTAEQQNDPTKTYFIID